MRVGSFLVVALAALTVPGAALAQAAPPANPPPGAPPGSTTQTLRAQSVFRARVTDSAFALTMAYHAIGRAENAGATGHYIDAARTHYRSAIARHGRNDDAGASAEARLVSDLARVAVDERPANAPTGPKDVPAPPTPRPSQARGRDGAPGMGGGAWRGMPGMPGMPGGPPEFGGIQMMRIGDGPGFGMRHGGGFDATRLAEVLKVETGPEARQLAQNAVDANSAAQRAALAGNVEEASRQSRISGDIAAAVHDLAALNHPELAHPRIEIRTFGDGAPMMRPQ
ncbi:MAG TPA: hypothetical protein VHS78_03575 [Candidatus Elarobacter sp.]|jgi:hypothetical protein|nr:hypothetical protein [Candidatus Elarobacter sp.]